MVSSAHKSHLSPVFFRPARSQQRAVVRDDGTDGASVLKGSKRQNFFSSNPLPVFAFSARILLPFVVATLTPQQAESSLSKPR